MDQPVPTIVVEPPKTNWLLFSLIGIAILLVGVVVGFWVGKYIYTPKPTPTPLSAESSAKEADPTASWKTYSFDECGSARNKIEFSIQFPQNWKPIIPDESSPLYHTYHFSGPEGKFQVSCGTGFGGGCSVENLSKFKVGDEDNSGCYYKDTGHLSIGHSLIGTNSFYFVLDVKERNLIEQILSTFRFLEQATPGPTCKPRPACLDATPRCMIPETSDMCPPNQKL